MPDDEEAQQTQEHYRAKDGTGKYCRCNEGDWFIAGRTNWSWGGSELFTGRLGIVIRIISPDHKSRIAVNSMQLGGVRKSTSRVMIMYFRQFGLRLRNIKSSERYPTAFLTVMPRDRFSVPAGTNFHSTPGIPTLNPSDIRLFSGNMIRGPGWILLGVFFFDPIG